MSPLSVYINICIIFVVIRPTNPGPWPRSRKLSNYCSPHCRKIFEFPKVDLITCESIWRQDQSFSLSVAPLVLFVLLEWSVWKQFMENRKVWYFNNSGWCSNAGSQAGIHRSINWFVWMIQFNLFSSKSCMIPDDGLMLLYFYFVLSRFSSIWLTITLVSDLEFWYWAWPSCTVGQPVCSLWSDSTCGLSTNHTANLWRIHV